VQCKGGAVPQESARAMLGVGIYPSPHIQRVVISQKGW
jgi:hypothetical protein